MMSDVAIKVEHLSKAYRIGLREKQHETFVGAIASFARSPFENYRNLRKLNHFEDMQLVSGPSAAVSSAAPPSDVIWSLKNVSFEVKHGEVLGIIGRNGAGKSTLLKILSRVTEPTSGRATIYGRIGCLLEVGTGFHPDLTGRENVYLNGTLLGMTKKEVDSKFDEIVDFSDVEKFIDTPVKRYSSGMKVRLAFSVAAHLEPEILIIDEVLAVGDMKFQKKCLGKLGEISQHGRTVLFVSHNMAAVVELCQRALVLDEGKLEFDGTAGQGVNYYAQRDPRTEENRSSGDGTMGFKNLNVNQSIFPKVRSSEPITITVLLDGSFQGNPWVYLILEDAFGKTIIHSRKPLNTIKGKLTGHERTLKISVPPLFVSPGLYTIYLKAQCANPGSPKKIMTERLPLEVSGGSDSLGRSVLSPHLRWQITT